MTEAPSGAFEPAQFFRIMRHYGHSGALGITYVEHGADSCTLRLPYDPKLIGVAETGILASGPIVSLMDTATSTSVWIRSGRFRAQATLDLRIDYLRPATAGRDIIGRGECYGLKRSVAFVRGVAHDGDPDDPIAHVSGTFMFTD